MSTVPEVRWLRRTAQYWLKVLVPSMEGALTRWLWRMSYVSPSRTTSPFFWAPEAWGLSARERSHGWGSAEAYRVVLAKGLENVVLNERVASPSVDGEVAVAVVLGLPVGSVLDGANEMSAF
jgi:hypothetical protein